VFTMLFGKVIKGGVRGINYGDKIIKNYLFFYYS